MEERVVVSKQRKGFATNNYYTVRIFIGCCLASIQTKRNEGYNNNNNRLFTKN